MASEFEHQIRAIRWFHGFELGGLHTLGPEASALMLKRADNVFKHPVTGKSVLDIGAWDGFFAFEAERRGASRVLATDHFCWSGPGWGTKAGFDLAARIKNSSVESMDIDVPDISPDRIGTFDVVLSLGVIYHLRDPIGHIEQIGRLSTDQVIVETLLDTSFALKPRFLLVKGNRDCADSRDSTNFLAPNVRAMRSLLAMVGFLRVECEIDKKLNRGLFHGFKR